MGTGEALSAGPAAVSDQGGARRPSAEPLWRHAQVNASVQRADPRGAPTPIGPRFLKVRPEMRFGSALDRMSLDMIETDFDAGVVANVACRIYAAIDCHSPTARESLGRLPSKRFASGAHFLTRAQRRERTLAAPVCCLTTQPGAKHPASTVEFGQSMPYESPSQPQNCGMAPPGRTDYCSGLSPGSARI